MTTVFELPARVTREWIEREGKSLLALRGADAPPVIDASKTTLVDSAGLSLLFFIGKQYARAGRKLVLRNASPDLTAALSAFPPPAPLGADLTRHKESVFTGIGDSALALVNTLVSALSMLTEILYWSTFGMLRKRDFRKGALEQQMYQMGTRRSRSWACFHFLSATCSRCRRQCSSGNSGRASFLPP